MFLGAFPFAMSVPLGHAGISTKKDRQGARHMSRARRRGDLEENDVE
jgi:hypothetical protein